MCLKAVPVGNQIIEVSVPPTRHDILHSYDIYEDVAIAYGYNKIVPDFPKSDNFGNEKLINSLIEQIRQNVAYGGFTESLTFILCSKSDIGIKMGHQFDKLKAVQICNPKTLEFEVVRTSLLPGLLKTISTNKSMPLPNRVFEISDVVQVENEIDTKNRTMFCAVNCDKKSGFEIVHGLLDRIMLVLKVPRDKPKGYTIVEHNDPSFFHKRCVKIKYNGEEIGTMGSLHPKVLAAFDLTTPCSSLEFDIEPFIKLFT